MLYNGQQINNTNHMRINCSAEGEQVLVGQVHNVDSNMAAVHMHDETSGCWNDY